MAKKPPASIVPFPGMMSAAQPDRLASSEAQRIVRAIAATEGPFVNAHGHWQMNLTRYAAGEEITCVVAIEWARRLIVITTF